MDYRKAFPKTGYFKVYTGPMFSEKTTMMLSELKKFERAGNVVQAFKPEIDSRYGRGVVSSHNGNQREAIEIPIDNPWSILELLDTCVSVIGIDEVQFFDDTILDVVINLTQGCGLYVIAAGLDNDYRRRPFGPMPQILALANEVEKKQAVCSECGRPASWTYRIGTDPYDKIVVVGAEDLYQARCGDCHELRTS